MRFTTCKTAKTIVDIDNCWHCQEYNCLIITKIHLLLPPDEMKVRGKRCVFTSIDNAKC